MTIQLRKASFRKWLREKRPRAYVGTRGLGTTCPVARYLESHGAPSPSVGRTKYRTDWSQHYRPTPAWAGAFIAAVDQQDRPRLTAADCLLILEATNA